MERCCIIDVNQLPMCPNSNVVSSFVDSSSIRTELLRLKAPLVLNMLEKRMGKGLLTKISTKLMLATLSGDLVSLSTYQFLKFARKVSGRIETKLFADQWIYGSGCPIFNITFFFNPKKMVIELKIKQRSSNYGIDGATVKFSGPFTVRVEEPGGTFDTDIKIEEFSQQYDIIYHTKYKRIRKKHLKKTKKQLLLEEEEEDDDFNDDESKQDDMEDLLIAEPDRITFESIRLDPENNWVCHIIFEQEDFMWNSILRKDKEIGGQYEVLKINS
jgi:hypothetical protein